MSGDTSREAERIIELGMTTSARIDEAKAVRAKMVEMGLKPRSLADILYEKGYIEEEHLEAIRREERRFQGQEQIAGYRLLELLGEGAMGTVYKAKQLSLDRDVAIKVLSPELAGDEKFVERFLREAKAVARLNHTNIISGIDVGDANGIKYFVMEYVDGATVAFLLRRGGPLDEERSLLVVQQIGRALDHAYRNGLVHRDIKPENVIITRDGIAKLCDLGLAKLEEHREAGAAEPTHRMGTPSYISPEQARGDADVDIRSDLYSLGITLYHMLVGRPPFEAQSPAMLMAKHLTETPVSPRTIDASITPATEAIIARLLCKRREDRYQTPAELVKALDDVIRSLQIARGAVAAPAVVTAPSMLARPAAAPAAPNAPPAAPPPSNLPPPLVTRRRR